MSDKQFDKLLAEAKQASEGNNRLPPVEKWDPPLSGDIDILINTRGEWFHEGGKITRETLVRLFASILKRELNAYFLVTPVEKWRIRVEDVPFVVTAVEIILDNAKQALLFTTNTGDTVVAGADNPLRVVTDQLSGEPTPYLMVRNGMEGRLNRNVFYRLADIAEPASADGKYGVLSLGEFFPLQ